MFAVPPPHEGRFAVVTDVGSGMRWTRVIWAQLRKTTRAPRTVKSCGPGLPTLRSSSQGRFSRALASDGGKKARSPRRARISRKTIAQGRPDVSAYTCGPSPCTFYARGPRVRRHPVFPAPSVHRGTCVPRKTRARTARRESGAMALEIMHGKRSPDGRSDIRGLSTVVPEVASRTASAGPRARLVHPPVRRSSLDSRSTTVFHSPPTEA
jgi:hypothetical protein